MAVTRIKNNQITDASGANTQLGVNAAVKLQNYSVTASKLANSLVYGSDLTVSGNLTVNGQTTTVDTVNTLIKDPIITLADGQTSGTPTVDIGFLGLRGNQLSSFMGWNEGNTEFAVFLSNTTVSNTTANINEYGNFHANSVTVGGNLSVVGNIIGGANFTGNVTAGNLISVALVQGVTVSASGNVIGGNINTAGLASVTGNVIGGNILTGGIISSTGNLTAGNISTAGNVTAANFIGNISGNIDAAGSNTQVQFNTVGDILGANANFTYDFATNLLTVNGGNIATGNLSATGNTTSGNVLTGGLISATGNATAGNLLTGGLVSATGNVTGGNIVTSANVYAENIVNTSANTQISMGNGSGIIGITSTANTTQFLPGGQITLGGASRVQGGTFTGSYLTLGTSQTDLAQDRGGNVTVQVGTGGTIANTWTFAQSGALLAPGAVSAVGNVTGGNVLTSGLISATGNVTGGNVLFGSGVVSGTGNITGGNLLTGGLISATGNATAGNVLTGGLVSATGNIVTSANIVTNNIVGSNVTITSAGIIDLVPTGNIAVNSRNINNLADPVADQDAATKIYVDTVAQGLDIKASVVYSTANTLTNLNGAYTYNNGASGVGATITFSGVGTFTPDGNAVSVGQRILVRDEVGAFVNNTTPSAAFNGIYVVTNAGGVTNAILTRSTDFDNGSPSGEIPGAFTFVEEGSTWADTGWVCTTNAPVTVGTTQIIFTQFSGAGSYTANTAAGISLTGTVFSALVDNDTTAFSGGGNIIVKAGANLTTPNIGNATGQSLQLTTAGGNGLLLATTVSSTGNTIAGNVLTGGLISATGNATAGNVLTGGLVSATGNGTFGNVNTANISLSGNVISDLNVTGNVAGGNILTVGLISATGNATAGNVLTGGLISATSTITSAANITGGNVLTGGLISATSTITSAANITGANITTAGLASVTGNVIGGNITTGGAISGTGNITGGNILTGGLISATGNITGANINGTVYGNVNATTVSASGNVTGGNVLTGGEVSATGNIAGGNILTGGLISATSTITSAANITGANILTGGLVSATGTGTFGNIVLTGDFINQLQANSIINVNGALANTNFAVNGTAANVFFVNASANTASFGTSAQTTNALVAFNTTTSIKLPAGTTGQRPATGVTGMFRFNSTTNGLELYNNTEWAPVGSTVFTVIADEQFNGDGSTVAFTLATSQTTNSCIVSINGVVQIPTSAYSVSTTTLTFTEAPAAGDLIDVREITTTTTVSALSNGATEFNIPSVSGNATVSVGGTANVLVVTPTDVIVTGNLTVTGNATLSGNILGDRIQNGTTTIDIQTVNGNANVTVGGTSNVAVFSSTMVTMAANLMPAANVTYDLGSTTQRWKDLWLSNSTIYLGNSQISANATALIFTNPAGGQTVLAGATAAITATTVSATGNVTGANVVGTNVYGIINTNSILNSGSNGTGNIGSSSTYFNTIFAKATSAQYADLAEKYVADAEYAPGTVVSFGGEKEVTRSEVDADRAVAGVVSTNPSYIMNATLEAEHVAVVAFTGRVPTSVTGTVAKGDLMVSNGDGTARSDADPKAGSIIGKALENFEGGTGTIEVVIGRF